MAGRPLLFDSVESLQKQMDFYFANTPREEWTITGLALALNTSRETLCNYQGRAEFFDTIKKGKDMVENAYELSLRKNGRSGDIFGLKNFGWKDEKAVAHTIETVDPEKKQQVDDALKTFLNGNTGHTDGK